VTGNKEICSRVALSADESNTPRGLPAQGSRTSAFPAITSMLAKPRQLDKIFRISFSKPDTWKMFPDPVEGFSRKKSATARQIGGYGNARFTLANSFRVRISFGNPFPGRCPGLEFANAFGVISKISLMRQVY
jgi:hypothetical protein